MTDEKKDAPELTEEQKQHAEAHRRIQLLSHHMATQLDLSGLNAHVATLVGAGIVGIGIDALARQDIEAAKRVAQDLAAGFVQTINALGLQADAEAAE